MSPRARLSPHSAGRLAQLLPRTLPILRSYAPRIHDRRQRPTCDHQRHRHCKIHHTAYDADIFGIDPNDKGGVRPEVMKEIDGPTLRSTLQEINGSRIDLPTRRSARPDPELLERRWQRFQEGCNNESMSDTGPISVMLIGCTCSPRRPRPDQMHYFYGP